jgi:hypothetical protein
LELPVTAAIGGVVDAGLVAGTGGHEESFVGGEGDYGTKVEGLGAGDLFGDPDAAVGGAEVSAVRTGGPRDLPRYSADAAESFGREGDANLRRRLAKGSGGYKKQEEGAHEGIVSESARER